MTDRPLQREHSSIITSQEEKTKVVESTVQFRQMMQNIKRDIKLQSYQEIENHQTMQSSFATFWIRKSQDEVIIIFSGQEPTAHFIGVAGNC